jgi:hypothetical protein
MSPWSPASRTARASTPMIQDEIASPGAPTAEP